MISLNDIVGMDENWTEILDSVLPGGENWKQFHKKNNDCMNGCPGKKCNGGGPDKHVCSEDWRKSKVNRKNLKVLKHVLENFEYYDQNDCTVKDNKKIDMLLFHIYHWENLIQGNFPSRCHENHAGLNAVESSQRQPSA